MSDIKWVYLFSKNKTDGNREMKNLLGGKGANLAEMTSLGINVPPGITITTEACLDFEKTGNQLSAEIVKQIEVGVQEIESITNKKFGGNSKKDQPLLFSVRSGARASMPGMMDTVLNLGLNEDTVKLIAEQTGNPRFAWDSYRRFIQMYSNVVLGFNTAILESTLEDLKEARGVLEDTDLDWEDFEELTQVFRQIILEETGHSFPTDPKEQLWKAIAAVFGSWNNSRAIKYRELNSIPHEWGTAVNVQSMVYGNMGEESATGVCFTRDPSTGEKRFFGEYLVNAQGEDVVAGIRTPAPINESSKNLTNQQMMSLEELMPKAFNELTEIYKKLEIHYRDMQDIEFTIENNELFLLQTRNGKRTTAAAIKIAVDLVSEGILSKEEAVLSVDPESLNQLLHPRLDPNAKSKIIAKGLPASPGAASGIIVFTSARAEEIAAGGKSVMLVRQETSPEDIAGMIAARGILTARGGMTSHAAVVARGMGRPCVAGCSELLIDSSKLKVTVGGKTYSEGDFLTIDGGTGEVLEGEVPTIKAEISDDFSIFMGFADNFRSLKVRANADNPVDSEASIAFGAEGIGLCRTEHMFFETERIFAIREMIFAQETSEREKALDKLLPYQKDDFLKIFQVMDGKPVNIRLLDPPLHEFLPHNDEDKKSLGNYLNISFEEVVERCDQLHEFNPMLGHRGCRLGITFPEIYMMQTRAIIEAAILASNKGIKVFPEIMIPLIATAKELEILRLDVLKVIEEVFKEKDTKISYKCGTMIELPRAAITAGEIAPHADFFSFGTNDLTQTTFGISRDDAGKFLGEYTDKEILKDDPFVSIDESGVGFLVEHARNAGKKVNPSMHIGICGEHGGDPQSIDFCHRIGLDYISCSPYRVPIARLAAAHSAIKYKK